MMKVGKYVLQSSQHKLSLLNLLEVESQIHRSWRFDLQMKYCFLIGMFQTRQTRQPLLLQSSLMLKIAPVALAYHVYIRMSSVFVSVSDSWFIKVFWTDF